MIQRRFSSQFTWLVVAAGASVCGLSLWRFPFARLDGRFLILSLILIGFSAHLTIQVPKVKAHISFSDTLIFLALLLYGGEAAVLLAAAEAICSSLRFRKKGIAIRARTILLNSALMAFSTFVTATVLEIWFGSITALPLNRNSSTFFPALCVMALAQYLTNSGLVAAFTANKTGESLWSAWSKYCLWSSITYFTGAVTAGGVAKAAGVIDFPAIMVTGVIIAFVYFTYHRYIEDIKDSARQAELAERERAEQAERHVAELNLHIEEQNRTQQALEESRERFRYAALHDALTGLPNRSSFTYYLRAAIEQAKQTEAFIFAVLFLDFDRFKYVNDSLGHSFGDRLLVEISRRLKVCVRQVDVVARFGGDEFAILLNGISDPSVALRIAERIQQEMTAAFRFDGHETFLSVSVGIALGTADYEQPEELLRDADLAMYRAKETGKARHEVFDKTMHAHAISRLQLENDLRRAIERQEFCLHYQPIVKVATGRLYGFEALVRWQHPERGLVSPMEFIPVAEETGLIVPLGRWVLEEACRQVREWQYQSPEYRSLTLSVNLSGKQLNDPKLVQQVKDILLETEFDPRRLKLEITESVIMENAEAATSLLRQLRALGLQLSIDDFGTGYSSLSYLHRFPVTNLKIDRSFVSRMGLGDENLEIVRTIVMLARNLRMEVVAEGIETQEQHAQLKALGCHYGQGYLFSRPLAPEAARAFIEKERQELKELPDATEPQVPAKLEPCNSSLVM
jgi:diguanylate cyclase (GGDEF)-like protein